MVVHTFLNLRVIVQIHTSSSIYKYISKTDGVMLKIHIIIQESKGSLKIFKPFLTVFIDTLIEFH